MREANKYASPIVNFFGILTGWIILVTGGGIFVVSACDMAYLCVPFTRKILYSAGSQAPSGGGMGMGMGMGMSHGGVGGFGASVGGSGGAPKSTQWVSDDALSALAESSGGGQQSGGMGMGMAQNSQQAPAKQVLLCYFKKRVFFLVLFGLCSVVLFSSVFIGAGVNVAQLVFKLVSAFNSAINGAF